MTTEPVGLDQMGTFLPVARLVPRSLVYIVWFVSALESRFCAPNRHFPGDGQISTVTGSSAAKSIGRYRGLAAVEVKQRLFRPLGRVVGLA